MRQPGAPCLPLLRDVLCGPPWPPPALHTTRGPPKNPANAEWPRGTCPGCPASGSQADLCCAKARGSEARSAVARLNIPAASCVLPLASRSFPLNARRREETPASMAQRGGALKAVYPRRRVNRRATTNRRFIVSALIETLPIHWLVFVVVRSAPAVGPYDGGAAGVSCGLCEWRPRPRSLAYRTEHPGPGSVIRIDVVDEPDRAPRHVHGSWQRFHSRRRVAAPCSLPVLSSRPSMRGRLAQRHPRRTLLRTDRRSWRRRSQGVVTLASQRGQPTPADGARVTAASGTCSSRPAQPVTWPRRQRSFTRHGRGDAAHPKIGRLA